MDTNRSKNEAAEKLLAGYNCAQAVLYSACDRLRFDKDTALKLACGFGAGMAREEEVCGAVSGAILAIGLRHGRGENEDRAKTEETYARTREFIEAFKARHGTLICRELIRCDLRTAEGQRFFKENDLIHHTCAACVQTAQELVEKAL